MRAVSRSVTESSSSRGGVGVVGASKRSGLQDESANHLLHDGNVSSGSSATALLCLIKFLPGTREQTLVCRNKRKKWGVERASGWK